MNAVELAERLGGKRVGGGFLVPCVVHDDKNPSLSIADGENGGLIVTCHAGCSRTEVLAELRARGWIESPRKSKHERAIVATYDYTDEQGQLLYQVVRYEPKTFRQRRPDGAGGWTWKLGNVRRVLYRLPELVEADPDRWVLIAEGEKDVDALVRQGLLATTNAGGASKWRSEYSESLRDRRVVIIPDRDESGRKHVVMVRQALAGIAREVKVLELPGPGKDASDWLAAGHDGDELLALVEQADDVADSAATSTDTPKHRPILITLGELLENLTPPDHVVAGLRPRNGMGVLYGAWSAGKSAILLDEACRIGLGMMIQGRAVEQGPIVIICAEGHDALARRVAAWQAHHGEALADAPIVVTRCAVPLLEGVRLQALTDELARAADGWGRGPAEILIDTLARNFGPGDESSNGDMSRWLDAADRLREPYHATIVIAHHTGHADTTRGRGASALPAACDFEARAERSGEVVNVTVTKMRDGPLPDPLAWRLVTVPLVIQGRECTSVTVEECAYVASTSGGLGKHQRSMLGLLRDELARRRATLEAGGRDPSGARVSLNEWRDLGIERGAMPKYRQAWHKVREALEERGLILIEGACVSFREQP